MNPLKRYEKIMEILLQQQEATVAELSERLHVTGKTIREDLDKLEQKGLLLRVHGGAVLAQANQFGLLSNQGPKETHLSAKQEIAQCACSHIQKDDIIALDGGSTTLAIARALPDMPLTVITNDLYIISELTKKEQIRLVVPGGYRVRNMLTSEEAEKVVRQFNVHKAFIAVTALHPERGLSVYTGDLVKMKRVMVETAGAVYAVADHSKFGQVALRTFAELREVDVIITDREVSEEWVDTFRNAGVRIEHL